MARKRSSSVPDQTTQQASARPVMVDGKWVLDTPAVVALTIAAHPIVSRVGERALLFSRGRRCELSRNAPGFRPPEGTEPCPIDEAHVSRTPTLLRLTKHGGVRVEPADQGTKVLLDGVELAGPADLDVARLAAGVVMALGSQVVLVMHLHQPDESASPTFDFVGDSDVVRGVRRSVVQVADLDVPVLVRGGSGTGKELVARAIHAASTRHGAPCITVNMATLTASTAASELFGHVRGAFTGAAQARDGLFANADGGTLFLDEIGTTPLDVQAMLLRAIEEGEIRPVGASKVRRVDVRLVTATDADLEAACEAGQFQMPLLQRLDGYRIDIAPLRERREDIGPLLIHFLRAELERVNEAQRLDARDGKPWLPAALVAALSGYDWPGNVRQLRNVARQLVIASRGTDRLQIDDSITALLSATQDTPDNKAGAVSPPAPANRKPADIPEDELVAALQANKYGVGPTAKALGISKASLYTLIERSDRVRTAANIPRDEIEASSTEHAGDAQKMAAALHVSERALLFRMKELGLK